METALLYLVVNSTFPPHPPLRGTFSLREKGSTKDSPLHEGEGGRRPGEGGRLLVPAPLAKLGQNPAARLGVKKGDAGAVGTAARDFINKSHAGGFEFGEGGDKVIDLVSDMVRPFAVLFEELRYRRIVSGRL